MIWTSFNGWFLNPISYLILDFNSANKKAITLRQKIFLGLSSSSNTRHFVFTIKNNELVFEVSYSRSCHGPSKTSKVQVFLLELFLHTCYHRQSYFILPHALEQRFSTGSRLMSNYQVRTC